MLVGFKLYKDNGYAYCMNALHLVLHPHRNLLSRTDPYQ